MGGVFTCSVSVCERERLCSNFFFFYVALNEMISPRTPKSNSPKKKFKNKRNLRFFSRTLSERSERAFFFFFFLFLFFVSDFLSIFYFIIFKKVPPLSPPKFNTKIKGDGGYSVQRWAVQRALFFPHRFPNIKNRKKKNFKWHNL